MLLTVELVIILRSVGIFQEFSDESLAEIASVLEEVEVQRGQTIIQKGDQGRSMYIINHGKVRVHDGEKQLAILSDRDYFGEMSALDPEPRMASVTSLEPTVLFRLDHTALYELMADHIEVVQGIIHGLCSRFRHQAGQQEEPPQTAPNKEG